ncbi:MAG: Mov34/MPN/PAD-1 family protein, partial [Bacteroidota bacterium]
KRGVGHQKIVLERWNSSGYTTHYLGEWHSHPQDYPEPSDKDIASWKEKLITAIYSSRYLYFIIVGIKETRVWEGDRRSLKIKKLDSLTVEHLKTEEYEN